MIIISIKYLPHRACDFCGNNLRHFFFYFCILVSMATNKSGYKMICLIENYLRNTSIVFVKISA